jgi:hypothetical protein
MISIASNGGVPGSSPKKKTRISVPTPPHRPRPMPPERTPRAMKPTTTSPSIAIRNQSVLLVVVDAGSGVGVIAGVVVAVVVDVDLDAVVVGAVVDAARAAAELRVPRLEAAMKPAMPSRPQASATVR